MKLYIGFERIFNHFYLFKEQKPPYFQLHSKNVTDNKADLDSVQLNFVYVLNKDIFTIRISLFRVFFLFSSY